MYVISHPDRPYSSASAGLSPVPSVADIGQASVYAVFPGYVALQVALDVLGGSDSVVPGRLEDFTEHIKGVVLELDVMRPVLATLIPVQPLVALEAHRLSPQHMGMVLYLSICPDVGGLAQQFEHFGGSIIYYSDCSFQLWVDIRFVTWYHVMGDYMKFNEFIQSKGFTIKSLAAAAGVSPRSLEQYSSGRYPLRNARLWFAVKVAKALDTTAEYLYSLDD